jgi:hypothetical protein
LGRPAMETAIESRSTSTKAMQVFEKPETVEMAKLQKEQRRGAVEMHDQKWN